MCQMLKVIRQSNKIPAQENVSMSKMAKNLILEKKFKMEAATKEKTNGKAQ